LLSSLVIYNKLSIRNLVDQNRCRDKCFLQKVEFITVEAIELLRDILLNETC